MEITIKNGKALVKTPYSPDFVKKIKSIGSARWNSEQNVWQVPEASIETVREFMMEVYGETDISDIAEKVDVKIVFNDDFSQYNGPVTMMGRSLCTAYNKNSKVKISSGVDFVKGVPESGGSVRYWKTIIPAGSEVIVHGVAKNIAEKFISENNDTEYSAEIIGCAGIDKAQLAEEKARLLKRLAEIEELLK